MRQRRFKRSNYESFLQYAQSRHRTEEIKTKMKNNLQTNPCEPCIVNAAHETKTVVPTFQGRAARSDNQTTSLGSTPQPSAFRRRSQRHIYASVIARRKYSFVDRSCGLCRRDNCGEGPSWAGSAAGSSSGVGESFVGEEDEGDLWRGAGMSQT